MALVLTLPIGEDFYIGHERVSVESIASSSDYCLRRYKDGKVIRIIEGKAVELFPSVFVSVGARGQVSLARVAIEAPRSVMILKGDNYRRNPPPR